MKNLLILSIIFLMASGCIQESTSKMATQQSGIDFAVRPVNFNQVQLNQGFWKSRVATACKVTIPFAFKKSEETNRINNFKYAAGVEEGRYGSPCGYDDSDVYKVVEGASYALMLEKNIELKTYLDTVISYIEGAQEEDGYLYTPWTLKANDYMDVWCSYSDEGQFLNSVISHELYNVGHMYEAAVAHYLATGERTLLEVAIKNADLIYEVCITQENNYYPGHQEIEIGLVKLFRTTNNQKYLDLARHFLDMRGTGQREYLPEAVAEVPWETAPYSQDHIPVIEQREAVGHSVRANYMYAAMADIAALTGDKDYLKAIDAIWENVVSKKLYLTGGLGAGSHGESYGANYDLPSKSYAETCAAIANVYWNHRMFLLHGESKYIDVLERTLYNGLLSGLSLEGDKFFYENPLVLEEGEKIKGAFGRKEWFHTSCCPSNLSRFIPSIGGYVYATMGQQVFVNLYMSNLAQIPTPNGELVIQQTTDYPWNGDIQIDFKNEKAVEAELLLRIPGWAVDQAVPSDLYQYTGSRPDTPVLKINGEVKKFDLKNGYAQISGKWKKGDEIEILLPIEVKKVIAHPEVVENRTKIALEYGPIVFCAEGIDNAGHGKEIQIDEAAKFTSNFEAGLLKGVNVLTGPGQIAEQNTTKKLPVKLIPYYAWSHRGHGAMSVWLERIAGSD